MPRPSKPSRPKRILRKLSISVIVLVGLAVIGETVARAIEPGPFTFYDTNPYIEHPDDPSVIRHRASFRGRWDGTWYETNTMGLRGPELELTFAPTEYRIAALGDSTTFGKGVHESHSWPRQLERMLAIELGRDWRPVVANLGVNGYSGATYDLIFNEIGVSLRPNLVVVGYNLNDFPNAIRAVDQAIFVERASRRLLSQDLRDFLGRFAAYRWARQAYYHLHRREDWQEAEDFARSSAEDPLDSEVWEQQKSYLASIQKGADKVGAKMAVFLFPYESQVYLDVFDETPIERLKEACDELSVPFVDLAGEFRKAARAKNPPFELFLWGDRYHPNAEGYHIVARTILELIRQRSWLPRAARD